MSDPSPGGRAAEAPSRGGRSHEPRSAPAACSTATDRLHSWAIVLSAAFAPLCFLGSFAEAIAGVIVSVVPQLLALPLLLRVTRSFGAGDASGMSEQDAERGPHRWQGKPLHEAIVNSAHWILD